MKLLSDFYTFPKRFWQSIIIGRFDSYTSLVLLCCLPNKVSWVSKKKFRILFDFSTAADADNLKLQQINFRLSAPKGRFALSRSRRRCFLLYFLHTSSKLHFYSLGTAVWRKLQVSRGMQSLWLWVSNRGEKHPVGTRFCSAKSSVLYLLRPLTLERGWPTPDRHFTAAAEQADFVAERDTKPGICHEQNPPVRV